MCKQWKPGPFSPLSLGPGNEAMYKATLYCSRYISLALSHLLPLDLFYHWRAVPHWWPEFPCHGTVQILPGMVVFEVWSLLSEMTCNSTSFDIGSEEGGGKSTLWSQLVLAEFNKLEKITKVWICKPAVSIWWLGKAIRQLPMKQPRNEASCIVWACGCKQSLSTRWE